MRRTSRSGRRAVLRRTPRPCRRPPPKECPLRGRGTPAGTEGALVGTSESRSVCGVDHEIASGLASESARAPRPPRRPRPALPAPATCLLRSVRRRRCCPCPPRRRPACRTHRPEAAAPSVATAVPALLYEHRLAHVFEGVGIDLAHLVDGEDGPHRGAALGDGARDG